MAEHCKTVLVTGGCGFIGSALIRHLLNNTTVRVVNFDKLTYAAMPEALDEVAGSSLYHFVQGDIADRCAVREVIMSHAPDGIINLAAESHVDHSIDSPADFVRTNVVGTFILLDEGHRYYAGLDDERQDGFRFLHVSTDEVFGSLSDDGSAFSETTAYDPRSPYAASKAAADHFARTWHATYGLPVIVTNCSNNYGRWQFPEKLIPVIIANALDGLPLPVYGTGANIRDWLHVDDHARALSAVFDRGRSGESYNIGGRAERRNIDVVHSICSLLDELHPRRDGQSYVKQISFVTDRPGHDYRYAIDCSKLEEELGWRPHIQFEDGLRKTVSWYIDHQDWWRTRRSRLSGGQHKVTDRP